MTAPVRKVALFDLDGTLSASEPGIVSSLVAAMAAEGLPIPSAELLRTAIGPPFAIGLPAIGVPLDRLEAVTARYRDTYGVTGLFDTAVFDGVVEMLDALRTAGLVMAVATSKPEHNALRIVEHLRLVDYFDAIAGADLETGRVDKAGVIARALDLLGVDAGPSVVMVGDRHHDVDGAREHGIDSITVGWGYGTLDEHVAAAPFAHAATPADVVRTILG
ncbi:HAD hydrolase-like protein [Desertimonas flava]|uniref:HAD hydrolase-like protein n=1 Tax=Desertimonas flava TaxID=2064846 RepID=UPI000E350128|nr:HAD hydrolase-like protein [Desertimonas flava]